MSPACQEPDPSPEAPAGTAVEDAPAPEPPKPEARPKATPRPDQRVDQLPPFKVLLHNDDHNEMLSVVRTITELTPLPRQRAIVAMLEAHTTGVAFLLVTHRERAELYREQFRSKRLTVTIEPA